VACIYIAVAIVRRFSVGMEPLLAWSMTAVLAALATVCAAGVSYRTFESPFLRLKERFARVDSRPV